VATDLGADRASPGCHTGLHLCTHPLTCLNLGARGDYPAYQSEIENFEPCHCNGGNHLVRDDVVLQDEGLILGLQRNEVTGLVENNMTCAIWLSAIAYHRNYVYFLAW
jgi:hypothetical protein